MNRHDKATRNGERALVDKLLNMQWRTASDANAWTVGGYYVRRMLTKDEALPMTWGFTIEASVIGTNTSAKITIDERNRRAFRRLRRHADSLTTASADTYHHNAKIAHRDDLAKLLHQVDG